MVSRPDWGLCALPPQAVRSSSHSLQQPAAPTTGRSAGHRAARAARTAPSLSASRGPPSPQAAPWGTARTARRGRQLACTSALSRAVPLPPRPSALATAPGPCPGCYQERGQSYGLLGGPANFPSSPPGCGMDAARIAAVSVPAAAARAGRTTVLGVRLRAGLRGWRGSVVRGDLHMCTGTLSVAEMRGEALAWDGVWCLPWRCEASAVAPTAAPVSAPALVLAAALAAAPTAPAADPAVAAPVAAPTAQPPPPGPRPARPRRARDSTAAPPSVAHSPRAALVSWSPGRVRVRVKGHQCARRELRGHGIVKEVVQGRVILRFARRRCVVHGPQRTRYARSPQPRSATGLDMGDKQHKTRNT
eukprot:scaffold32482_cov72-Phaeocystis_antarctica.AAC.3